MKNIIDKKIYEATFYQNGQDHRIALFDSEVEAKKAIEEYLYNGFSASVNEISVVEVYSSFAEFMPKKAQESQQKSHQEYKSRVWHSQTQEHEYEKLIKSYEVKLKYQREVTEKYKEELKRFEAREILAKDGENIIYKTKYNADTANKNAQSQSTER